MNEIHTKEVTQSGKGIEQKEEEILTASELAHLRDSEKNYKALTARLHHIFDTLDNSFWGADMINRKILYVSPGNEKICGYTNQEFFDNVYLWYELIIPEDKHKGHELFDGLKKGNLVITDFRIRHKNGDIRWIELRITPVLDEKDKLTLLDGIVLDITERKQAEEKFIQNEQQLLEAQRIAGIGNFIYNFKAGIWKCSSTLDELTGLNSEEIMVFENWIALISPDVKEEIVNKILPLIQEGIIPSGHYLDCKIKRADDGQERWVSIVGEVERDIEGKPVRLKGTVQDITERKKAEDEIKRLNESLEHKVEERTAELKQLNKELEAFNHTVSHDLQNPIRSLAGFSRLLINDYSDKLDEDGKEYLTAIEVNAKRMSALVRDLLGFAKLGKIAVAKVDVDMKKVAQATIDEIKSANTNLSTKIILHDLAPAFCDAGLIRQVWDNLIGNAVKYSSRKENPTIEIGMQRISGEDAYYVKDNGAGFDMKYADKLFKVFERLHNKNEFEGTGVGLSTAERIITKQGGRIWAEGEKNVGAIFYFTVPPK